MHSSRSLPALLLAVLMISTGPRCASGQALAPGEEPAAAGIGSAHAGAYNPLEVRGHVGQEILDTSAHDAVRERDIPLRIYLPDQVENDQGKAAPVILFSHGLGGTCKGGAYLGRHWAARGYVAVFMQHPGSDDSVWKDVPPRKRLAAAKKAASSENFLLRVQDVAATLDQLEKWNKQADHKLAGRLDLTRVGMSGHSFGAITTQAVSGQSQARIGQRYTDDRIDAALALSPSAPSRGEPDEAFGSVRIPWMLMTGTQDTARVGDQTPQTRQEVYPALPKTICKYELVLHEAKHSAFGDRAMPGEGKSRNPNHHRAILALSTAFFDTHLRGDSLARQWLHGPSARAILEAEDRWRINVPSGESNH